MVTVDIKTKQTPVVEDVESEIEKELQNWDVVRCARCGREISMLNASMVGGGMFFVCKESCN